MTAPLVAVIAAVIGLEWRYLKRGTVRHALVDSEYLSVCGAGVVPERSEDWLGTGTQDEYERVASLPACKRCTALLAPQ